VPQIEYEEEAQPEGQVVEYELPVEGAPQSTDALSEQVAPVRKKENQRKGIRNTERVAARTVSSDEKRRKEEKNAHHVERKKKRSDR
jgi:hypothetical protein